MRPYNIGQNIDPRKPKFNKTLRGESVTIERGFGILKAHWRCLLKRLDSEIEDVSNVIITCVVLHNVCQFSGDEYLDEDEVSFRARFETRARSSHQRCSVKNVFLEISKNSQ